MKKLILFISLVSFLSTSCNSQTKTEKGSNLKDTIKPKIDIKVQKDYDENGKLIRVDSTYSYFYSNIKNDSILEKEIYDKFRLNFEDHFRPLDSIFLGDFFGEDPFNIDNFYTDEFFENNFKMHQNRIEQIMKEMDSLKNNYYKKQKLFYKDMPKKI
ncbi:MAG: hypothetical protein OEW87_09845 [Flavobacteriaceae bacterium]|nr:hypothetical protein [Flavobacteriaceae bacterium]